MPKYGVYKKSTMKKVVEFKDYHIALEWASEENYETVVQCLCIETHFKGSVHAECYRNEEHNCHERICECDCHYPESEEQQ